MWTRSDNKPCSAAVVRFDSNDPETANIGIIVTNQGATDFWADGIIGVPDYLRKIAAEIPEGLCVDTGEAVTYTGPRMETEREEMRRYKMTEVPSSQDLMLEYVRMGIYDRSKEQRYADLQDELMRRDLVTIDSEGYAHTTDAGLDMFNDALRKLQLEYRDELKWARKKAGKQHRHAAEVPFSGKARRQIREWMVAHLDDNRDPSTGIIDATGLAEEAAYEFDLFEEGDIPEVIYELSSQVAEAEEQGELEEIKEEQARSEARAAEPKRKTPELTTKTVHLSKSELRKIESLAKKNGYKDTTLWSIAVPFRRGLEAEISLHGNPELGPWVSGSLYEDGRVRSETDPYSGAQVTGDYYFKFEGAEYRATLL